MRYAISDRGRCLARRLRGLGAGVILSGLVASGCATSSAKSEANESEVSVSVAASTTVLAAVVTTTPPSDPVQTAVAAATPAIVTPVVEVLPVPISPPTDENADEAVVELGSIEIPSLGLLTTLYEGIRLPTFDRGPGHWPGTAMPGEFGNAVIGGHRTSGDRPFRHLDDLVPGDPVVFTTVKGRFVYHVTSTEIVFPDDLRVINQNPGFTATLFACHPVGSTRERIIVHLSLVSS